MSTATMPRERPILFSAPMVRAILAGTKTQTRRILKSPRSEPRLDLGSIAAGDRQTRDLYCPYGAAGDRLWVRETHAIERYTMEWTGVPPLLPTDRPLKHQMDEDHGNVWWWAHYRATDPPPDLCCEEARCRCCNDGDPGPHWRPSIHMPRWACRIVLEITDVRVQRLHDISQDDAVAEGIDDTRDGKSTLGRIFYAGGPRDAFAVLWKSINGAESWDANPWVWALTFRRLAYRADRQGD